MLYHEYIVDDVITSVSGESIYIIFYDLIGSSSLKPPSYDQPPPYNSGRQRSGSNNGGWNWGSFGTGFGAGSFFNQTTQQRNNGYTRHRNRSRSPPSRSPSRSSGSAGTRTASGFGGTTRR